MDGALAVAADVLVVLGLVVSTLGVVGIFRMPDTYNEIHAASKAVVLGIVAFLLASVLAGGGVTAGRAVLIAAFLFLTAPVSAHVIARATWQRDGRRRRE
jgi:multicomponent Na+:H+ antiporter subunit G